jgi:hypothetical protein
MKFSMFSQPPTPTPRNSTSVPGPVPVTMRLPETRSQPGAGGGAMIRSGGKFSWFCTVSPFRRPAAEVSHMTLLDRTGERN